MALLMSVPVPAKADCPKTPICSKAATAQGRNFAKPQESSSLVVPKTVIREPSCGAIGAWAMPPDQAMACTDKSVTA